MKLAGVVILYNPGEDLLSNIASYIEQLEALYIMDNSEERNVSLEAKLSSLPNAMYRYFGDNQGIGLRLNQAADMAAKSGFTHLLTMDQDSSFEPGKFSEYVAKCSQFDQQHRNRVGIFAVNYQPGFTPIDKYPKEVLSTITSGSIINLAVHAEINGYNADLFLDLVDADFCYRANKAGYITLLFSDIILLHKIGERTTGRSFKTFKKSLRQIHSPVRMYYLLRNSLYLLKYGNLPDGAASEIKNALWLLKNNLLYHPKRSKVFYYVWRAYVDFKKKKLGKFKS